jgi:branched-chain amino acid transport system substrate-binding protein
MSIRILAVATLVAGALTGLQAQAQQTVQIGVIEPMTGPVANNGIAYVNGAKLAVAERNRAGGVLGKQVELLVEDGQCKPANSVNAAEKLIQKDKVTVLNGAFCSSATIALMPLAERYKIPLITGVSSKADLTEKGNQYFFRATETDLLLANAFAKIMVNQMQLKKIAYIGVNDDWGRGSVSDFSRLIEGLGGVTAMKEYYDVGTTDYYTLLTRLRASGADGVFVAAETQDGSIIVRQMKELGITAKIFGVGSWATAEFAKLAGPAAEGIYAAVPYAATMQNQKNKDFVARFQAQYKDYPGKYSAAGFNVANIIMDAIQRAGSTDSEKIRVALKSTNYEGPNGKFAFDAKGQAYGFNLALVQLKGGRPEVIATTTVELQ